jgi:glycosyltransferase involved in cell wall biosynthesis
LKILIVSHAANRSGAPLVLLELVRFLKRETEHEVSFLSLRAGEILPRFLESAKAFTGGAAFIRASQLDAAKRRLSGMAGLPSGKIRRVLGIVERINERVARRSAAALAQYDVIYANCAASGSAVKAMAAGLGNKPLVVHVHEMQWALEQCGDGWEFLKKRGDFFIAASAAVADELKNGQGIAPEKIAVVHEFLNFANIIVDKAECRQKLRSELKLPADAFLVGSCGTMEWRKGGDLWVQMVAQTGMELSAGRRAPDVHFVWLGAAKNSFRRDVEFDAQRLGVTERIHFLPSSDNPDEFFAAIDAFAMTSREDPFPLVALEAAAQGSPVVCFKDAGGTSELVGQNAGVVVPYADVNAMAKTIESWRRDRDFRDQLGENAQKRAREMGNVEVNARQIVGILERLAG